MTIRRGRWDEIARKQIMDFFDEQAALYDLRRNKPFLEKAIAAVLPVANKIGVNKGRFLEIGVGTGELFRQLSGGFQEAVGLDISASMVRIARGKVRESISFALLTADACLLPFRTGLFDFVVCMDVLEHISRPHLCFHEIIRVLKPSGRAVLTTPNPLWSAVLFIAEKINLKVKEGKHKYVFISQVCRAQDLGPTIAIKTGSLLFLPIKTCFDYFLERLNQLPMTKRLGFSQLVIVRKN